MGGGLESRCVGRVYGADGGAWHHLHRTHDLKNYKKLNTVLLLGCFYPMYMLYSSFSRMYCC